MQWQKGERSMGEAFWIVNEWKASMESSKYKHGYGSKWKKRVCKWPEIERADVEKAIADIKCGKVEGINGVTLEMVTY